MATKKIKLESLRKLGLNLSLVQTEQKGKHYSDENGHLFSDGSYLIEEYSGTLP